MNYYKKNQFTHELTNEGKAMSQGYGIEDDVDVVLQLALFGELVYG